MIQGLQLANYFIPTYNTKQKFNFTLKTKTSIKGPLRSIQKFVVILLTNSGSDSLRPWFGTKISLLNRMNISNRQNMETFVREECNKAITQFFQLQAEESSQNEQTGRDVINTIELTDISITAENYITITFKFTPLKSDAIIFSINYSE